MRRFLLHTTIRSDLERRGPPIGTNDLLIAAQCVAHAPTPCDPEPAVPRMPVAIGRPFARAKAVMIGPSTRDAVRFAGKDVHRRGGAIKAAD